MDMSKDKTPEKPKVEMTKDGRFMLGDRLVKVWPFYRHGHGWDVAMESEDRESLKSIHTQPGMSRANVERLIASGAHHKAWQLIQN